MDSVALERIRQEALLACTEQFAHIDTISLHNTQKVLAAYRDAQLSSYQFAGTSGYGYSDLGREKLDEVYARVFRAAALFFSVFFVFLQNIRIFVPPCVMSKTAAALSHYVRATSKTHCKRKYSSLLPWLSAKGRGNGAACSTLKYTQHGMAPQKTAAESDKGMMPCRK